MRKNARHQSGSIFIAIFGAIAAVGVVGTAAMTTMKGPVLSMHNVTQKTIAENNMIAACKLALMAAVNQPNGGDCDSDGTIEPLPFSTTGDGAHPAGGGYLPGEIAAAKLDPWGNEYGYCVWDHGSSIRATTCGSDRLRGVTDENGIVLAVISSGPDRVFQTSCGDAPDYVIRESGSDDIVLAYSYAEAATMSGGLWNLKIGEPDTAEISKSLEVRDAVSGNVTFALDSASGIGDFIGIVTGTIASKTASTAVQMSGGLQIDTDENVDQCNALNIGTLRYHLHEGLQVCNGTDWQSAGGGAVPAGTIAAFAQNGCPSGWSEYSPARGRFLRGRDPTGENDVVRNAGTTQGDMNKAHSHTGTAASAGAHTHTGTAASAGAHTHTGTAASAGAHTHTATVSTSGASNHAHSRSGNHFSNGMHIYSNNSYTSKTNTVDSAGAHTHSLSINSAGNHTHSLTINSAGNHTHALTINSDGGVETRPKNVAVTFCQYDGGVPVTQIAGLDNLHDVTLSAPQTGQTLTFDGTNWVNVPVADGVPSGAVMTFDLNTCPSGWEPLEDAQGRFIVGAGNEYSRGDTGGANSVALTVGQLPAHNHSGTTSSAGAHTHQTTGTLHTGGGSGFPYNAGSGGSDSAWRTTNRATTSAGAHTHSFTTNNTGSGEAHENRPPYLALLYCRKA